MTSLNYDLGSPRTPLNINPAINSYFQASENKRNEAIQRMKDFAFTQEKKDQHKKKVINDLMRFNTELTPSGTKLNEEKFIRGLYDAGYGQEAMAFGERFEQRKQERTKNFLANQKIKQQAKSDIWTQNKPYLTAITDPKERARLLKDSYKEWKLDPHGLPDEISNEMLSQMDSQFNQEKFGVNPIYGVDSTGTLKPFQLGSHGSMRQAQIPEGVNIIGSAAGKVDLGDRWGFTDKGGNVIRTEPKGIDPGKQADIVHKGQQLAIDLVELDMAKEKSKREGKKFTDAQAAAKLAKRGVLRDLQGYADLAKELRNNQRLDRATGVWSYLPTLRGSKTADIEAQLKTLKAKSAISSLKRLKSESSTGASGMGSLSERELDVLIDAYTTLQTSQSAEAMRRNLKIIEDSTNRLIKNMKSDGSWGFYNKKPGPLVRNPKGPKPLSGGISKEDQDLLNEYGIE